MKIQEIHARHEPDQDRLSVRGTLNIQNHLLPFHYKVNLAETDTGHHEKHLRSLHEKGVAWVDGNKDLHTLIGTKEKVRGVDVEIMNAVIRAYAPNHWEFNLSWKEDGIGVPSINLRLGHPSEAPDPTKARELLVASLLQRHGDGGGVGKGKGKEGKAEKPLKVKRAEAHLEAISALAATAKA